MISQPLLNELQTIIKQDYGIELSQSTVVEVANTLTGFFELLAKIESEDEDENENFRSSNS